MSNEMRKILKRKEFYFSFLILFLAVIFEHVYKCYMFREVELRNVISASEASILNNISQSPFIYVYTLLLPLLVSIVASTIAYEEKNYNLIGNIYTRVEKKKYIYNQYYAIFVITSSMVFICLLVSAVLALTVFPITGHFSYRVPEYVKILYNDNELLFDKLLRFHPYINMVVFMFIRAMFAGALACFSYGISYIFKNRIVIIISPLIFILLQEVLMRVIGILCGDSFGLVSNTMIFATNHYGSLGVILVIFFILIVIGKIGIEKGIKEKDEI